jgi:tRNA dimethylallyltransferase
VLHARIATRFDAMLAAGFVEEVRGLLARPGVHRELPALRAVGYRQVADWLATGESAGEPIEGLREKGIVATRQLAKRQLTWLRSWPDVTRFDCLSPTIVDEVAEAVARTLARQGPRSRSAGTIERPSPPLGARR